MPRYYESKTCIIDFLFLIVTFFCKISNAHNSLKGLEKVNYKAIPFNEGEVSLLDSKFKNAMQKDAEWLLSLEADRLLSRFREYAGLKPKAEIYGGWESRGVSGHSLGHYLSALSLMYGETNDVRFKNRVDYIVKELTECQVVKGTGYIGVIPNGDTIFDEVAARI